MRVIERDDEKSAKGLLREIELEVDEIRINR